MKTSIQTFVLGTVSAFAAETSFPTPELQPAIVVSNAVDALLSEENGPSQTSILEPLPEIPTEEVIYFPEIKHPDKR